MSTKALIVYGGWEGHEPKQSTKILGDALRDNRLEVTFSDTLDALRDESRLLSLDLIVLHWTMGKIEKEQLAPTHP